jgi:ArsR family transcriptional regulator, arsenate/arsenite/antimonite-responsive transcriptional repressor
MIDACLFPCHHGDMPKPLPLIDVTASAAACCAPLSASPLSVAEADQLAAQLKALADPTRLRLVSMLLASENGEACTCDVTEPLGVSQPTVSHHFRKLAEAGIVTGDRRGTWTYYRVVPEALTAIARVIDPAA